MYYGNIKPFSIENGTGVRVSLFVSGCRNACPGCFSRQTWDFCYGELFTDEVADELIALVNRPFAEGLTILGGEPMEPENQRDLLPLYRRFREHCPGKNIWVYTGFCLEKASEGESGNLEFRLSDPDKKGTLENRANTEYLKEILESIDVLVDGRFAEAQKNLLLNFRGSENQRIICMKETLESGEIVLSPLNQNDRGK